MSHAPGPRLRTTCGALAALALIAGALGAGRESAQELGPRALRQRMKEMAEPGPHHRALEPLLGRFRFRAYFRLTLDDNPESAHGVAESRWILDGRFLEQELRGRRLTRSFEGRLVLGFDNYQQTYVGTWLDEYDPGITTLTGPPSADGRTMAFEVLGNDPRFAGQPPFANKRRRRGELVIESENRHVLRFFERPAAGGDEITMAEITFERVAER